MAVYLSNRIKSEMLGKRVHTKNHVGLKHLAELSLKQIEL